jgi:hypothetical protein
MGRYTLRRHTAAPGLKRDKLLGQPVAMIPRAYASVRHCSCWFVVNPLGHTGSLSGYQVRRKQRFCPGPYWVTNSAPRFCLTVRELRDRYK